MSLHGFSVTFPTLFLMAHEKTAEAAASTWFAKAGDPALVRRLNMVRTSFWLIVAARILAHRGSRFVRTSAYACCQDLLRILACSSR
jgi:hypothetical protein